MTPIIDIHTHRSDADEALISVDPRHIDPQPGKWYSVGFHPWHGVGQLTQADFDLLEHCAAHPQVLAIGETGIDHLRGDALQIQTEAFIHHLRLSHDMGKPVVAHCVKAAQDILAARHEAGLDDVPLIIHGMRGNQRVARILLDAGCYLSFGPRFNPAAVQATPPDRLLIETDDSTDATIQDVAASIALARSMPPSDIIGIVTANASRLLFP
jgi:TatD DNase family protein